MRIQSTETSIEYAGRNLVQPGGFFDGDAISDSLETTAQAVELVSSQFVRMEQHKNARTSSNLSFVQDFDNIEDAVLFKIESQEHATSNATGSLTYTVGSITRAYEAALTRLDADISLTPDAVRVTLTYSFIIGQPSS